MVNTAANPSTTLQSQRRTHNDDDSGVQGPPQGLRIATFGGLTITHNGQPVAGLASRKAEAMLVYLACTRKAHERDVLGDLLWDDVSISRARGNLSVVLTSLRQQLGPYLQISRQTVALDPNAPLWVDAVELEAQAAAVQRSRRPEATGHSAAAPRLDATAGRLERALGLYRGDFLQGFALRDGVGFEEWMLLEQERLRRLVLAAGETLVQAYLKAQAYAAGLAQATTLLRLDPLHEELHRQIMRLLTYSGQRGAALAHYEACRRTLDNELGVSPSPETTTLYEHILKGKLAAPQTPAIVVERPPVGVPAPKQVRGLPFQPTPFVGRNDEREQVAQRLADPACRLLTLIGPGGMGKTRLAIQAAQAAVNTMRDGAAFVALAALDTPTQIGTAIAQSLGASLGGQGDATEQLLAYLRPKQLLLVLDNFEHLVEGGGLLNRILEEAPGVTLLVTSRERMNLQAEWLIDLAGLQYPTEAEVWGDAAQLLRFSAVQLWVQQAVRVDPSFRLGPDTIPAVLRICRLVEGMPLALELAAAWVRTVPPAQIAAQLAQNLDLLATSLRDVPTRHRSVRSAFDHSWALLSAPEQSLLRHLAVFRGGFTREAVAALLSPPSPGGLQGGQLRIIPELALLVDKSLLRQLPGGRYELHELLRQFAAERLAALPELATHVQARHATHFLDLIAANESALMGRAPQAAVARLGSELDNIRQAWEWATTHDPGATLGTAVAGLSRFYILLGLLPEGTTVFAHAVERLRPHWTGSNPAQHGVLLSKLLMEQANLLNRRGRHDQALAGAQAATELAHSLAAPSVEAEAQLQWAEALLGLGSYATAEQHGTRALALAEQTVQPLVAAGSLRLHGLVALNQGDYSLARQHYEQALERFQSSEDCRGESAVLNNLGVAAEEQGDYAAARAYYEQSIAIRREIGDRHGAAFVLSNLGVVAAGQGAYAEAQALHEQGLTVYRETGDRMSEGIALDNLGNIATTLGDCAAAHAYHAQSLHIRREIGDRLGESYSLASQAMLGNHQQDYHMADQWSREAVQLAQAVQARSPEAIALMQLGHALLGRDRVAEAQAAYGSALALRRAMGEHHRAIEATAGLANALLAAGDAAAYDQVAVILLYLTTNTLDGIDEPFRIYLTCYRVLQSNHDPRAAELLATAQQLLGARAAQLPDPELRRSFLEQVAIHRAINEIGGGSRASSS